MVIFLLAFVVAAMAAMPGQYHNGSMKVVPCDTHEVCVKRVGERCTLRTGYVTFGETFQGPLKTCAAPMKCLRDWKNEDEGICVMDSVGMPCLMNNFLGDCTTLLQAPNSYCVEGRCKRPPSFPGDHCWVDGECTAGSTCVNQVCRGVPEGGLCTNQFRLCDVGLFCPNAPPGHAKCQKQLQEGEFCHSPFSLLGFLEGLAGVQECAPGLHCSQEQRCVSDESVKAGEGEACTLVAVSSAGERLCKNDLWCHPQTHTCQKWPEGLWKPCEDDSDCPQVVTREGNVTDALPMQCNCRVGGIKVCELAGEEILATRHFLHAARADVSECIRRNNCWRGQSAFPRDLFNEHSCVWRNCRSLMARSMYELYCDVNTAVPHHRSCVMDGWCQDLHAWSGDASPVTPPPQTPAPEDLVPKLSAGQISGIVVGSLALTLLVFFSGFIVGWLKQKYNKWRGGGASNTSTASFTKLDNLVENSVEL